VVGGRDIDFPGFRVHGRVLVPGSRFPVAFRFVVDHVDLREQFDRVPVRVAVVCEKIVARAMPSRPLVHHAIDIGRLEFHIAEFRDPYRKCATTVFHALIAA